MKTAIVIASYRMPDFVRLNVAQVNSIFQDTDILISDDLSDKTEEIEAISGGYGAAFVTSNARRGHCAGKVQAIVSGLAFAEQEDVDILLILNQRLIPASSNFRHFLEEPFSDPKTNIVVAGRATASQLKLPASKYFSGLGILTDIMAIRVGSISPVDFLKAYQDGFKWGKFAIQLLPEIFITKLLGTHFKDSTFVSSSLGDAKVANPVFLRREQSKPEDYQALASQHGCSGGFDVRDWMEIEKNSYVCRPSLTV